MRVATVCVLTFISRSKCECFALALYNIWSFELASACTYTPLYMYSTAKKKSCLTLHRAPCLYISFWKHYLIHRGGVLQMEFVPGPSSLCHIYSVKVCIRLIISMCKCIYLIVGSKGTFPPANKKFSCSKSTGYVPT